ncbi:MAG: glycerol-3-phosphate 1-O-acyltransferase PlsY [Nitrospirota bacterium]
MIAAGLLAAFLLGSIPSGVLAVKWLGGIDPRKAGSGNIGFTNVRRVASRTAAGLTLAGDVGKGALAVWLMRQLGGAGMGLELAAGLAAVMGHMFSPFVQFKGGKGVATALGVLAVAAPWAGLITLAVWAVVLVSSSYVSLASIVASAAMPVTLMLWTSDKVALASAIAMAGLVIARHRDNIQRLRAGTEPSVRASRSRQI